MVDSMAVILWFMHTGGTNKDFIHAAKQEPTFVYQQPGRKWTIVCLINFGFIWKHQIQIESNELANVCMTTKYTENIESIIALKW